MATADRPARTKRSFRTWRRTRPFWGGLITIVAAVELYGLTAASAGTISMGTIAPAAGLVIGLVMLTLVGVSWTQVNLHTLTGPVVIALSLASLMLVNLGGFFIGALLGIIGGSLTFAWTPSEADPADRPGDTAQPDLAGGNRVAGDSVDGAVRQDPYGDPSDGRYVAPETMVPGFAPEPEAGQPPAADQEATSPGSQARHTRN